jgi:hypothetical protein
MLAALSFAQTIRVDSNPSHVAKTFAPTEALGAGTVLAENAPLGRFGRVSDIASPEKWRNQATGTEQSVS